MATASGAFTTVGRKALGWGLRGLSRSPRLRTAVFGMHERYLRATSGRDPRHPPAVGADRMAMGLALAHLVERALAEDRLSDAALCGLVQRLVGDVVLQHGDRTPHERFRRRHGSSPPDFLTIAPGKTCNLRCTGCYAAAGPTPEKLDWGTLDRLVTEAHDGWGVQFFVLSGGEPFAYHDDGKGILDLAERHPECFFLSYTNGTLITDEVARRLAAVGNLSPGLSIEGMRERTDARRGAGVFEKVLAAADRMRAAKVVFGLSLTATRENSEEILSDEVLDLFVEQKGALYAWVFHYMPIGRAPSLDLMLTPEQRVRLHERVWHLVRDRRLFIADFWNSGTATCGCVAGGRAGGYLYVDWNGAVCPCVFVPYSPVNLKDAYAAGRTLDDVWSERLFARVRAWQRAYGYRESGETYDGGGNWLMPCLIRDHHRDFRRILAETRPQPTDAAAGDALEDAAYAQGLEAFDARLSELTQPLWEARYQGRPRTGKDQP